MNYNFYTNKYSEEELINFAKQNLSNLDWNDISKYQKLSESFIERFKNKIDWEYVSRYQKLSENFIRKFKNRVDWVEISFHQNLSENFIQEFQYKVNWGSISQRQKLSEKFIRKFKDKIYWENLSYNIKVQISDEFTIEFDKELGCNNEWAVNDQYHRMLGPAVIGHRFKEYWYRGKQINVNSDKEYFDWLKVKDF